jgi:hypothetical protein|tara:strand:- start:2693 stop:4351 length:1659 start_codon:yes stop_codon:yes gene_type:complete
MTGFKLQTFSGQAPKVYARLLPEDMAQVAENCRLDSGRLEPWRGNQSASISPVASYTISSQTKTLFRYSDTIWIGSDEDINIVRSPVAEDPHERLYITGRGRYTSDTGFPQMTSAQVVGNGTYYRLGMPDPANIDAVTLTPVTSEKVDTEVPQTRSYLFTYVSAYGEEGAPSIPQLTGVVEVHTDQTATIDFPPNPSGAYNLSKKRLYRTDSSGTYRFVADVPLATDTVDDSKTEGQLGEAIPTASFIAPPDDVTADHTDGSLQGLVSLPNGILAGFAGQTVCFSEAFQPHAFPDNYKLTMKSDVVAIAPINSGLLVLTKEKPAVVQGLDPSSMAMQEIDSTLSCVSKRSVVDMGQYVMYASPDGLAMGSDGGLQLVTEDILTREQWQEFSPSSIIGFYWEGHYIGFYANSTESKGFIFDPRGGKNTFVTLGFHATAGFNDLENDELYLVVDGNVVKFASGSGLNFSWRTKKFYSPKPINPAVARVDCDDYSSTPTFKLYADGVLKHTETVSDSNVFRLPSGYKAKEFEIELTGSSSINEFCVYESAGEIGV